MSEEQRYLRFLKLRDPAVPSVLRFDPPPSGTIAYKSPVNKRVMRGCACIVADALASKRQVLIADEEGRAQEFLSHFAKTIEDAAWLLRGASDSAQEDRGWRYQVFSDSIILAEPVDSTSTVGEGEIGWTIDKVARFQLDLALGGFFLRGGIAIGRLHMDDEITTGAALVRASCVSNDRLPGIYLDDTVASLVRHYLTYYGDPGDCTWSKELLVDSASSMFVINYLQGTNYGEFGTDHEMIQTHAAAVRTLLSQATSEDDRRKAEWLCSYHNFFLDNFIWGTEECNPIGDCKETRFDTAPPSTLRRITAEDAKRSE